MIIIQKQEVYGDFIQINWLYMIFVLLLILLIMILLIDLNSKRVTSEKGNNGTENVGTMVPLKYLNNF